MQKVMGIDVDNVLADFNKVFKAALKKELNLTVPNRRKLPYYFEDLWPEHAKEIRQLFNRLAEEGMFRTLPLIPGARKGLKELHKTYKIIIVSSRPLSCYADTMFWLMSKGFEFDDLIIEMNKPSLGIPFSIFIEDKLETAIALSSAGTKVYLFDKPWNRTALDGHKIMRFRSWFELLRVHSKPKKKYITT